MLVEFVRNLCNNVLSCMLQLALNQLDLSSQKTKVSVGRSGSIGGRRPPSRPRSLIGRVTEEDVAEKARLQQTSRFRKQLHDETITNTENINTNESTLNTTKPSKLSILERQNGDGSVSSDNFIDSELNGNHSTANTLENFWIKSTSNIDSNKHHSNSSFSNSSLKDWKKSAVSKFDNITNSSSKTSLNDWRDRKLTNLNKSDSSNLSENSTSISKFNSDTEADRRLNTALRGNNVDLEALDQILKSISSSASFSSDNVSLCDDLKSDEQPERDVEHVKDKKKKRHSFITVESLQEVRGRLRRLSSPIDDYKSNDVLKDEEPDDGIVEEDSSSLRKEESTMPASNVGVSRVKSYVYGMEAMLHNNKKPIIGTGSLESRTSSKSSGNSTNRSEDWYNRRKSYGFEQVHNQQIDQSNSISLRGKNKIESSTDSAKSNEESSSNKITTTYGKIGNSTVINLNGDNKNSSDSERTSKHENELFNMWNRRALLKSEDTSSNSLIKKDAEQLTIRIPIVSVSEDNIINNSNSRKMFYRQMSDGSSMSIESYKQQTDTPDVKRHSIAVDESKYVNNNYPFSQTRRTSLAIGDTTNDQEDLNLGKKQKKVEFCKTEVHFAAESGRVNIVETDEKPPPTQNFRRRRRNSSITTNHIPEDANKTGLPLIHFGDTSYEKKLFGVSDPETGIINDTDNPFTAILQDSSNNVTVSSISINQDYEPEKETQENENQPRGILKNKMAKPKPYILGDEHNEFLNNDDQESTIWGVRLRPIHKQDDPISTPIWRSTVSVQNTSYNLSDKETFSENDQQVLKSQSEPEFQKMLHSLRPARSSEPNITSHEASTIADLRRSSWSVADRIKQVEDLKQESKGYSTRVNFGSGEATVVENGDIEKHTTWPRHEDLYSKDFPSVKSSLSSIPGTKTVISRFDKHENEETRICKAAVRTTNNNIDKKASPIPSPKVETNINHIKKVFESNEKVYTNGTLSSPSLVGNSIQKSVNHQNKTRQSVINQTKQIEKKFQVNEDHTFNRSKESPNSKRKILNKKPQSAPHSSCTKQIIVPKKIGSCRYFESSKPTYSVEKWSDNRPDLLKNHHTREYVNLSTVIHEDKKSSATAIKSTKSKTADIKKITSSKITRPDSPSIKRPESPIYENIDEVITNLNAMEKESTMLQELTKAADQILQAVNGYTDEDSKLSTDSEEEGKKHRLKFKKAADLSTISETKSWKQQVQSKSIKQQASKSVAKGRVKPTSSTSSIESLTKESKPVPPVRLNRATRLNEEKMKKKIIGSNSELSKITKARRLQRASSREALLQSHGSSSEDIATNNIESMRKPRLVRKTKTPSVTTTEETTSKKSIGSQTNSNIVQTKKKEFESRRSSDRIPVIGLQEIRHKTAVSTIKSTAEKAASRERALKAKAEELKKKSSNKRDLTSSKSCHIMTSSHHGTTSTQRSSTATSTSRGGGELGSSGGTSNSHHATNLLSSATVRTSSGVITKKHSRNEGIKKY